MLAEHFFSESAIKAFDERILVWFSGPGVLHRDTIGFEPAVERFAKELGPVMGTHYPWRAMIAVGLFEHAHQSVRVARRVDLDVQDLAVEVVDDARSAEGCPQARASLMKSTDQAVSGNLGTYSAKRARLGGRRFATRCRLSRMALCT